MAQKESFDIGKSSFWILTVAIAIFYLAWLGIYSYQNPSVGLRGIIFVVIFGFMILSTLVMTRNAPFFTQASFTDNSFWMVIGFLGWGILKLIASRSASGSLSVFELPQQFLLSSIAGSLPASLEWVLAVLVVPIAEELFWMFLIPWIVITVFNNFSKSIKSLKVLGNAWSKIIAIILLNGISFVVFHVGNADILFQLSAFVFRAAFTFFIFADELGNIFEKFDVAFSLSLGAHIGHNFIEKGVGFGFQILTQNFLTVGLPILISSVVLFLFFLNKIGDFMGDVANA